MMTHLKINSRLTKLHKKNRPFCVLLVMMLTMTAQTAWANAPIYNISNYAELKDFAARVNGGEVNANACLTADIVCTDNTWTPIGDNIHEYNGRFDGCGHTITGLSNAGAYSTQQYVGLFGYVGSPGEVMEVILVDVALHGGSYMGSIAGYNKGKVQKCYVANSGSGSISATGNYVGGIVGYNNGGTIQNCHYSGSGAISANNYIGGIVGYNYGGMVNCCYYAGKGAISGSNNVGGVIGLNSNNVTATNCFYNKNNTTLTKAIGNADDTGNVKGLTAAEFQDISNFTGFSTNVWIQGIVAPLLKGMKYTISFNANGGTGSMANQTVTSGNDAALRANTFTRDNYHFMGWNTKADGSGVAVATDAQAGLVGPETLYAQWEANTSGTCGNTSNDNVAWAVTDTDGNGSYETLTISGTGAMADFGADNQPWVAFKSDITTAVIGDGVTSIGNYAFYQFTALTSVTIDAGTTQINDYCFWGTGISVVVIPASVASIGSGAFSESSLDRVYFLRTSVPTLESNVFLNCHATLVVPATAYYDYSAYSVGNNTGTWEPGYAVTCGTAGITATTTNNGPLVELGETVTLSYTGSVPTGNEVRYSIDGGTTLLVGNTFQMPDHNVTVTAVLNGPDQPFVVTTYADLKAKMATGGYIRVGADVSPSSAQESYLTVPKDVSVTLDLNGHTIDQVYKNDVPGYRLWVAGTLTLNDSGTGGTIKGGQVSEDSTDKYGFGGGVFVAPTGSFTMNGGTVTGGKARNGGGGVYIANSDKPLSTYGPSWDGNQNGASYDMKLGTTASIDLKRHISGFPSPIVSIDPNNTTADASTYNISDNDIFTFKPTATGTYQFDFMANSTGLDVIISVGTDDPTNPPTDSGSAPHGGTFIMNGGTISGNKTDHDGGGVYVEDGCTFTMNGGTISNNEAHERGGGVYANWGATVNLNGGTITGNSASSNGGGVFVKNCEFNVSGSLVITGNEDTNDDANNVYLPEGKTIKVSGPLSADARIGVTTMQTIGNGDVLTITSGLSGKGNSANLVSDKDDRAVVLANGELALTMTSCVTRYGAITFIEDQDGKHGVIDGNYSGSDAVELSEDVAVEDVTINRTFPTEGYSTLVLPFNVMTNNICGVDSVLSFAGIAKDNNKWECAMQVVWEKTLDPVELQAYTPYMLRTNSSSISITGPVTFEKTRDAFTEKGDWEFRGIYSYKVWDATHNNADLGKIYGFAATAVSEDKIEIGDFVRATAGAYIYPLRAYLNYKGTDPNWDKSSQAPRHAMALDELPDRIPVRVIGRDGETTSLSEKLKVKSEKFATAKEWYTLDGRKLSQKPTAKGVYIHNGRKEVVK